MFPAVYLSSCYTTFMINITTHTEVNQVQLLAVNFSMCPRTSSYMTPSQVTKTFTSINHYRVEVGLCERCHCVVYYVILADVKHDIPESFSRSGLLTRSQVKFSNGRPLRIPNWCISMRLGARSAAVLSVFPHLF